MDEFRQSDELVAELDAYEAEQEMKNMPKNHCLIQFNVAMKMWQGSHNGKVLSSSPDLRSVEDDMLAQGYNIQRLDTSSDPDLAAAIIQNGCD